MTRKSDWQLFWRKYFITHDIGHGYFGSWNEVVVLFAAEFEQILLELWQLPRAKRRLAIDHIRHVHFDIAVFTRMSVEHKLDQGSMQLGDFAFHDSETR